MTKVGDADYIYYSFFLDYKYAGSDWHGLTDISTTNLLIEERKRKIDTQKRKSEIDPTLVYNNDLYFLEGNEIEKGIQLLNSPFRNLIQINVPKDLIISIDTHDEWFIQQNKEYYSDVLIVLKTLREKSQNKYDYDTAYDNLFISIFINFIVTHRSYTVGNEKIKLSFKTTDDESPKDFVIRFFSNLNNVRTKYNDQEISNAMFEELSRQVPIFIQFFTSLIKQGFIKINPSNTNNISYKFELKEKADEFFKKFYSLYSTIKGITKFLDFRWRGLSTGEQSFLSLMSRFHSIKQYQNGKDFKRNLIILIDEGDAGFHPEWQRQFFDLTLNFLSELFKDHELQLIYTANAPFITSDLTKSHVIFIEKSANSKSNVKVKNNDRKDTFGANIHSLFTDAFYMNDVLIGDFAKRKINKIIDYLRNPEIELDESVKKTILLIGEPIIKSKLLEMWYDKFGDDEKIKWHKEQIEDLENKKKQW